MYRISPSARFSRVGWNQVAKVLMLTRALTWSRNWSQGFPASLSRPTWVAVVIVKDKTKPLGYFHRCVKAVESSFSLALLQASGFLSAFGCRMPPGIRGRIVAICRPTYRRSETARDCLRLTCPGQAKSVRRPWRCCTRSAQLFHSCKSARSCLQIPFFHNIARENLSRGEIFHKARGPGLRKTSFTPCFLVGPAEQVKTQRIASDEQLILLDKNRRGLQARAFGRINLVGREAVAGGIEVQQVIVQGHPNLAARTVHPQCRQDALKGRRIAPLFLPVDLPPHRDRRRQGVDRRVLDVLAREAQPVILPHGRLG